MAFIRYEAFIWEWAFIRSFKVIWFYTILAQHLDNSDGQLLKSRKTYSHVFYLALININFQKNSSWVFDAQICKYRGHHAAWTTPIRTRTHHDQHYFSYRWMFWCFIMLLSCSYQDILFLLLIQILRIDDNLTHKVCSYLFIFFQSQQKFEHVRSNLKRSDKITPGCWNCVIHEWWGVA